MLAKQGISVTIVEQAEKLDDRPRATHYGPPAMKILNSAGVGDEVRSKGFIVDTVAWRRLDGSYITGISHETQKDSADRMVALPLSQLAEVLYDHAKALPKIQYLFNRKVVDIGQDESKAWIDTVDQTNDEQSRLDADYVVGCDGASSIVRRSLFGDWKFPGKTWDEQIVATNVSLVSKWA